MYGISERFKGYPLQELEVISTDYAESLKADKIEKIQENCEKTDLQPGEFATVDFGVNKTGLIELSVICREEGELALLFDEILGEDGLVNCTRLCTANILIWKLKKGSYVLRSFSPYTMKYLSFYAVGASVGIKDIKLIEFAFPQVEYSFDPDEKIRLIEQAALETFRQNAFDIFMDCPSRERAGWLCDSFFTGRVEHLLTGENQVETNFLENYLLPETFANHPRGLLPMCYPSDQYKGEWIPNWTMWFVIELYEHEMRCKDSRISGKIRRRIDEICGYFARFENKEGLLENLEGTVFVEWSKANELTEGVSFPTNMLYAKMLSCIGRLYGEPAYEEKAERIRSYINRNAVSDGFYCDHAVRNADGVLTLVKVSSETCQYYAFFTDTADPSREAWLWNTLLTDFGPDRKRNGKWKKIYPSNMFIGNYLRLDMLHRYGQTEKLREDMIGYFYGMALTTGTLWEMDDTHASLNHGFASYVLYLLQSSEKS